MKSREQMPVVVEVQLELEEVEEHMVEVEEEYLEEVVVQGPNVSIALIVWSLSERYRFL